METFTYRVGFKDPEKTDADLWWPEGALEVCDVDDAIKRHDYLLDCAKRGERVEECAIEHVFIQRVMDTEVMLGTWPDGFQIGPWAAKGAAA